MKNKVRKTVTMALMILFAVVMWGCQNKNANMPQILTEIECDTIVCSDDGILCCYGLSRSNRSQLPHMIIRYTANGETHWVEEMGVLEDCHLCLSPKAIYHVDAKGSTIYLVYGYGGYTGFGNLWCLNAYRLENGVLEPALVFDGFEYEESICKEVLFDEEDSRDEMLYYNSEDSTICLKEKHGCLKYKWNGEKFVPENSAFDGIVKRYTNKDDKDFEFMYGVGTAHPWSCYVTEDSLHVLKLEKVHSDSFGDSFRALIFEPAYWCKGTYRFPELGSEPTFVGYGTAYSPSFDYIDFSFINGFTDSDETYFVLSSHRSNWDSILVGNLCPPVYSSEYKETCVFKKQPWDKISSWWSSKQVQ